MVDDRERLVQVDSFELVGDLATVYEDQLHLAAGGQTNNRRAKSELGHLDPCHEGRSRIDVDRNQEKQHKEKMAHQRE